MKFIGLIALIVILIFAGLYFANYIPIKEDLSWQCQRCPDVCRDEDGNRIDDLNEDGSCICVKENGECIRKIKKIVYTAPKIEPENFLGPHVFKEAFSDWMTYEPIINKVEEITAGITNDKEKAVAIANWVKNSRPYKEGPRIGPSEESSIANQGGTIIDIFEAEEGVCLDAAILSTAMMRLADIPAMTVQPSKEGLAWHAVTYFYAEEKWWQIDPVFGGRNAVAVALDYDDVAGGDFDIAFTTSYLCNNPYEEETAFQRYTYYLDHPVTLNKYGSVCLPSFSRYGQSWERGYMSPAGDNQYHWLFYPGLSLGDSHANLINKWDHYVIDEENTCEDVRTYYSDYLYCLDMPIGNYNVTYYTKGREDYGQSRIVTVATLKFEIKENIETKLITTDFVKHPDSTDEEYELFIEHTKKILSYS